MRRAMTAATAEGVNAATDVEDEGITAATADGMSAEAGTTGHGTTADIGMTALYKDCWGRYRNDWARHNCGHRNDCVVQELLGTVPEGGRGCVVDRDTGVAPDAEGQ